MRRTLPIIFALILVATPALAWDRPNHYGRPAPSWHGDHRHGGWQRPWRPQHGWHHGWHRPPPRAWHHGGYGWDHRGRGW